MAFNNMDMGSYFYVGPRFCELKPLGYGGGGVVYSAVDSECDKSVAIKKISLRTRSECKKAIREVRILRKLQHENILKIHDVIYPLWESHIEDMKNVATFQSIYIIQELADTDFRHLLEKHKVLGTEHTRLLCYQMFRGLKYLHSANVVHRDLKPENLLVNIDNLMLKIGDFGMARIMDPQYPHKGHLTQNVSTQWYRSPEQMIHPSDYTKAIDLWSCGCIMSEMVIGKPLFPGDHDLEQMLLILETIPLTDLDMNKIICTLPSKLLKNYAGYPRHPLENVLHQVDKLILDLLKGLLTFDPLERINATEALAHPFFKVFACVKDEPVCNDPFFIEDEVDCLSPNTLRHLMFEERVSLQEERKYQELEIDEESECKKDNTVKEEGKIDPDNSKIEVETSLDKRHLDSDDEKRTANEGGEKHVLCKEEELSEKSYTEEDEKSDEDVKMSRILDENMTKESKIDSKEKNLKDALNSEADEDDGAEKSEIDDLISEKSSSIEDVSQDFEKSDLSEKAELEISCTKENELCHATDNTKTQDENDPTKKESNKKNTSAILTRNSGLQNKGLPRSKHSQLGGEALSDESNFKFSSMEPAVRRKILNSSGSKRPVSFGQEKTWRGLSEKTLDFCLQEFSHLSVAQCRSVSPDSVNPLKPLHLRDLGRSLEKPLPHPMNLSFSKVQGTPMRDALFVEIPASNIQVPTTNLQVELEIEGPKTKTKPESPKNSVRGVGKTARGKSKNVISPRDKSVRPKRKNSKFE